MNTDHELTRPPELNPDTALAANVLENKFTEANIPHFFIGSYPRWLYMGKDMKQYNSDLDIIIPNSDDYLQASQIIQETTSQYPNVEIDASLSEFIRLNDDGTYRLQYGSIEQPIHPILMESRIIETDSTKITTLPPQTLLHMYAVLGGPFREKDWHNSLEFARATRGHDEFSHDLYQPFHEFSQKRWNSFPLRKIKYAWRSLVNSMPSGMRSALIKLYKNDQIVKVREKINILESAICLPHNNEKIESAQQNPNLQPVEI